MDPLPGAEVDMLRALRTSYANGLKDFAASSSSLRVVRTIPHQSAPSTPQIKSLYVLDASFNPPTKAHHRIASTALLDDPASEPKGLLILLATQNADKNNKPASMENRLTMMTLFAHELLFDLHKQGHSPLVQVGIVKHPYFHDKAAAIDESDQFPGPPQQVHLLGFDTLIRLFNAKYYPSDKKLKVLEPFLSRHRLRVSYRPDSDWGSSSDQQKYVQDIADGKRASEGAQSGWASQISLVDGRKQDDKAISSTLARAAAGKGPAELDQYVMPTIRDWIVSENLYQ